MINNIDEEKQKMLKGLIRKFEMDEDEFQEAEQKMLITSIHSLAVEELKLLQTTEKMTPIDLKKYPALNLLLKLGGKRTCGVREAIHFSTQIIQDGSDNYQKVIDGSHFTIKNMSIKNMRILVKQWKEAKKYVLISSNFFNQMTIELSKSKVDYKTAIAKKEQDFLTETRNKILELSKQYKEIK